MNGVLYIAFGGHPNADHIREAVVSVQSLKSVHPDMHTTVITDSTSACHLKGYFDNMIVKDIRSERVKQDFLEESPYDRTLYLDTDTKIVNPIDDLFGLLDKFDIAASIDHARKVKQWSDVYPDYAVIPASFPEFAGGVILYRKTEEMKVFFAYWRKNYEEWKRRSGRINDQPSFRVTMWECNLIRPYVLPPEYNLRTEEKRDKYPGVPRIYHWHNMYDPNLKRIPQRF